MEEGIGIFLRRNRNIKSLIISKFVHILLDVNRLYWMFFDVNLKLNGVELQ